mmetsp:Transcript_22894/g.66019  ORF Transcript_22894/g.66019 Transcript_22894/m.66019 type:complete len:226 (+) Transcript_22894:2960-3637(+)
MLAVDGVNLLLHEPLVEEGRAEEVGESVESLLRASPRDLCIIDRDLTRCVGVVEATALGHEVIKAAGVRVLRGAEEEHVLAEVREARQLLGVVEGARLHGDGEAGRGRVLVLHVDHLEAVGQHRVLVGPRVTLWPVRHGQHLEVRLQRVAVGGSLAVDAEDDDHDNARHDHHHADPQQQALRPSSWAPGPLGLSGGRLLLGRGPPGGDGPRPIHSFTGGLASAVG